MLAVMAHLPSASGARRCFVGQPASRSGPGLFGVPVFWLFCNLDSAICDSARRARGLVLVGNPETVR